MTSLRRPVFPLLVGLAAVATAFGQSPEPAAGPAQAAGGGVPVEVAKADGTRVNGTFDGPFVRLATDYGAVDLDPEKLDLVTLTPDGTAGAEAAVELHSGEHLAGKLAAPLAAAGVDPKDVRGVTFKHPKDASLTAALVGLVTLALMEIVLGIDNIIFLAIVAAKLPREQQPRARRIGLLAALGTRILLLLTLSWLLGLTRPLFTLPDLPLLYAAEARAVSGRDLILLVGGAFLIGKSVFEMHEKLEHARADGGAAGGDGAGKAAGFASVIAQIAVIDIIFSLDSVITAVGMVDELWVMITAMLIAVGVMAVSAEPIARFVDRHPTIKVLALSFLILIGVLLVADGLGQHMDKRYIYFAMAFGVGVELVNMQLRGSRPAARELPEADRRPAAD